MYIILVYDIVLDEGGAKVWRNTFKTCKKYLCHIQNSVFEGELNKSQLFTLKKDLANIIRKDRDSLLLFISRDEKWLDKEILGKDDGATDIFL